MKSALLLVDLQNDFCRGGALAVTDGDATVAVANKMMTWCKEQDIAVVASQDWHPAGHRSFATNSRAEPWTQGELNGLPQVWWPVHCVQHEPGAEFHPALNLPLVDFVVQKGTNPDIDSYSAFFDNGHRAATVLNDWLKAAQITHLYVMGLATDYCVKFTVLDALELGYQVTLLTDGCRGVNLQPEDSTEAVVTLRKAGAKISTSADITG
ncbi:bifunctional nicotinamidase/pyrazinamidase [Rahnella sp. C60]|jgi:nicotinamidase/pyrazinamidase|uniref:nicotinamidase n=1 Tax=Rahnella perminowiae TaxID=2816244 RepID=A0ABS6L2M7_9GAMM|nr:MULTISPECIES: bifunctional nicotinamidase/pyrazinamidase [Rahnella]UJD89278.1 bifunctional nicotinamidase/pyrazinamidase [Rahnella aquatilis]MBU9811997.1 bifunctional nicotinamidase/pyrazinamidase [Rahnella perminowiae]MBU9817722.1 bifunctional nicotinamidase/pyrazinamidase [Rahnella perminowiae]MBU9835983.1 bifunctional nicotinamidase/pyrazinamidase [Rahnella perminowiae]MCR9001534.1 bifunctional nicotinamidase/pyrazinamidase [Rahnella perminowiae]